MKTAKQVREELKHRGENMAQWARRNGFKPSDVRNVLYGKAKANWGESHKIAVKLGIKAGEIIEEGSDLCAQRSEQGRNFGSEVPTFENCQEIKSLRYGTHG